MNHYRLQTNLWFICQLDCQLDAKVSLVTCHASPAPLDLLKLHHDWFTTLDPGRLWGHGYHTIGVETPKGAQHSKIGAVSCDHQFHLPPLVLWNLRMALVWNRFFEVWGMFTKSCLETTIINHHSPPLITMINHHSPLFLRKFSSGQVQFGQARPAVKRAQAICKSQPWVVNHLCQGLMDDHHHKSSWPITNHHVTSIKH